MLNDPDFDRARTFLLNCARPLERALFTYQFAEGDADAVREALVPYRGANGGFGRALEPDVRTEAVGAYPTTIALQALLAIGAPVDDPLVAGALDYLEATYDAKTQAWQKVPAAVNDAPHAPWWHDPRPPVGFEANVGAEVLAYFLHWRGSAPVGLADAALEAIVSAGDDMEMHDLLCWLRLAALTTGTLHDAVVARLRAALPHVVSLDPAAWSGYVIRPLAVAAKPGGPLADLLAEAIDRDLDLTESEQGAEGAWWPVWSWEGPAWEVAKVEWAGVLTLQKLQTLAAYGRVARV